MIFYHNVTKNILNELDEIDFLDNYSEGDTVLFSESGNSLVYILDESSIEKLKATYNYDEEE